MKVHQLEAPHYQTTNTFHILFIIIQIEDKINNIFQVQCYIIW